MQEEEGPEKPGGVLLVDDDPRQGMMIGEMLRAAWSPGLVVSHAARVTDATQWLADHGVACVLLDLAREQSPDRAVERIGEAAPHAPIIVLSDAADEAVGLAAIKAGAQDCLLKPALNAAVLSRAVRYAVERKRSEVALAVRAMHDPLTSLPNRAVFLDRLRVALDRTRRTDEPVVVLFLDVDGFKQINDTLGHAAGDRLLTVLADRFRSLMRPMDTVARFGGDEFTFLFEGLEGERDVALVAERISRAAGAPLALGDGHVSVSVSVGATVVRDPSAAIDDVIGHADAAMYRAKARGGARYQVYERGVADADGDVVTGREDLERALVCAVERDELRVHYQPRVSLNGATGLDGFEALVRWEHPERGLMDPADFMPIAEATGLVVPIGEWVLHEALCQVQRWRRARPNVTISVNLSARQLADPGLVDRLHATIRAGGHDPSVLCLEVPEGALAAEPDVAARQLAALDALGISLAVDDFGTGHAPQASLRRLPIDVLKIDRTLVARLGGSQDDRRPITAAVALGRTIGCRVVAEGVETDMQLAVLRELGCDGAQGFLFSQPMSEAGVRHLLATE